MCHIANFMVFTLYIYYTHTRIYIYVYIDRQTDRQIDRQIGRYIDTQRDRYIKYNINMFIMHSLFFLQTTNFEKDVKHKMFSCLQEKFFRKKFLWIFFFNFSQFMTLFTKCVPQNCRNMQFLSEKLRFKREHTNNGLDSQKY